MRDMGLAIRFPRKKNPKEVVNVHFDKEKEVGKVAFSTGLLIDKRKITYLEKLIFFWLDEQTQKNIYVQADIHEIKAGKDSFVPDEWECYIPEEYKDIMEPTWILISNITIAEEGDLEKYVVLENGKKVSLVEVLKRPRFPRVFFARKEELKNSLF